MERREGVVGERGMTKVRDEKIGSKRGRETED